MFFSCSARHGGASPEVFWRQAEVREPAVDLALSASSFLDLSTPDRKRKLDFGTDSSHPFEPYSFLSRRIAPRFYELFVVTVRGRVWSGEVSGV